MWDLIAKLGVMILGAWAKRSAETNEARILFVKMVNAMQKSGLSSVRLGEEFEEQLERIRMEEEKEKAQK